ncbi:MAG TPA: mechanosensitive ion channel domain-containing protein [Prolixibacteraceae bacterium]|nr:mechanosensitive ion channel domain-containing protein [Prolixibacteraceae bacterium]
MELFGDFGQKVLLELGNFKLTISQSFFLFTGFLAIIVVNVFVKQSLKHAAFFKSMNVKLSKLILRTTNYLIWIFGLVLLLRVGNVKTNNFFEYEIFSTDKLTLSVQKVFFILLIFFAIRIIALLVDFLMNRKIKRNNLEIGKGKSIIQITKYLIWMAGLFIAFGAVGLKLTFIIASVSALLVGVGFGLQNIFNDFFSGIIILFDGSIKVNDVVQVSDIVGRVKDIGIRTTKVLNRDNIILIIPNSKFTSDNVINWSHHDQKTRFNVPVGVAYGSDVELVRRLLLESAGTVEGIVEFPEPFVRFEDFGESSLDFRLFFWSNKSFYVENIRSDLRFKIDALFRANNVTIPFPQRDLHVKSDHRETKPPADII